MRLRDVVDEQTRSAATPEGDVPAQVNKTYAAAGDLVQRVSDDHTCVDDGGEERPAGGTLPIHLARDETERCLVRVAQRDDGV